MAKYSNPGNISYSAGTIITSIGSGNGFGRSLSIQINGKMLLGGYTRIGETDDFSLVRYNINGSLDTTFGNGGSVTTSLGQGYDQAWGSVIQSDGKIILGGWASNGGNRDFALVRYNYDGSVDASFGIGGKAYASIGKQDDVAYAVALQSDGKIILTGGTDTGRDQNFTTARFNADGSLDASFGLGGSVVTPFSPGDDWAQTVAIGSDGRIFVAGTRATEGADDYTFALVCYNASGTLDTNFGTNGKIVTQFGTGHSRYTGIALQEDGKILVGGWTENFGAYTFALVRYNSNGSIDTNFGNIGKVYTTVGSRSSDAECIAVQADGKIILAGNVLNQIDSDFAIVRYNSDGSLDTSFGSGGAVAIPVSPGGYESAESVKLQSDGKIVVGGWARGSGNDINFAIVRLNPDGSLDTSFDASISSGNYEASKISSSQHNFFNEADLISKSDNSFSDTQALLSGPESDASATYQIYEYMDQKSSVVTNSLGGNLLTGNISDLHENIKIGDASDIYNNFAENIKYIEIKSDNLFAPTTDLCG